MNTKTKGFIKKFIALTVSIFIFNSFVLNDFLFAFTSSLIMPVTNIQQQNIILNNNAKITETFFGATNDNNELVIFIQDLHGNVSVQKNISEILKSLDNDYGIDSILLEGLPDGQADLSILEELKGLNISDPLLSSNILSGPEHYLINNKTDAKILGLENWQTYIDNIRRSAQILEDKEYISQTYAEFKKSLYSKNPKLNKLQKYINFDLANKDLLSIINQPILQYNDLHKYISICNNINEINTKNLNKEYSAFIKDLKNNLDFKKYDTLINLSKNEDLNDYYNVLYTEFLSREEYIKKYKELHVFLKNTTEKTKLNLVSLISQQNKIFNNYLSSVSDNKTQQDIFVLKMTQLFEDFLQLSISDENYNFFIENYERYLNLLPKYLAQEYYEFQDLLFYDLIFDYHKVNKDRNNIFLNNIINSLNNKTDKNKLTVVIAGGFHTSIAKNLKDKNISYIFITPTITQQTDTSFYNNIVFSTNKDALAPIKIMLANAKFLPPQTISVFFESMVNALATANDYSFENVKEILLSVIEQSKKNNNLLFANIPISIKTNKSNFIIDIDGQELRFKIEDGKINWEKSSVKYNNYIKKEERKSFIDNIKTLIKKKLNIFQATSMKLNPDSKYSSKFFSKRLGKRKSILFNLSMIFSVLKSYKLSYNIMIKYAKYIKNDTLSFTIDFDDELFEELKSKPEFITFAGKKINIILEKGLEAYLKEQDLKELFKEAIKRVGDPEIVFKDTLFIGFLDRSTNLFEDHLNNGFIGINAGILEIEDETVKQALIKTGVIHEISHEIKGYLSTKKYTNFENKVMYDDIKYIIDYVAKTDYDKKKDEVLEEDEVSKIKEQIVNAFSIIEDGKTICLFSNKNRFIKKIVNYKYSVIDMISFVIKKNISDERRREVELKHLEECLSPEDSQDKDSVNVAKAKQKEFFYNLYDAQPKNDTLDTFLSLRIPEERRIEIQNKKRNLYLQYANILNIIYPKEMEQQVYVLRKDYKELKRMSSENLKDLEKILNIDNKTVNKLSKTEMRKILKLNELIKNFDNCLEAMYQVMPLWMFEAFYNEKGVIADHALNHSIEVLSTAMKIVSLDFGREVDTKTLVYSALLHDISCTIFRQNHEQNSSNWARRILENGSDLTSAEIDKICIVGLNHNKYKQPLKGKEDFRKAHIDYYEAGLLHDADGLTATLDLGRVLGVWLAQEEPFINRDIEIKNSDKKSKIKDRLTLIKKGLYLKFDGGDAVNDLMRQFYRRNPDFYVTKGGRELANAAFQDQYSLMRFLDSNEIRERIKKSSQHISDKDIDEAIRIINETFATDDLIPGYEKKDINEIREVLKVKIDKKDKASQKESMFTFYNQLSVLYKIMKGLPSESNIVLSDMHGGYNRLSEILIKLLDSNYDIDEILKIFNNGDLNADTLTDEDLDKLEDTRKKLNRDIIDTIKVTNKNIYILGDMLDRGDKQIETFELINEISKTGKLRYIMGNHDIYAFMNLLGLHLPFYDNYKGISEDYTIELFNGATKISVLKELEDKKKNGTEIERANLKSKEHWASKLYEYMQEADKIQNKFTKNKNEETGLTKEQELQNLFKNTFGFQLDAKGKDVLNNPTGIFSQDEKLLNFHKNFFGRNVGVVVYTGIRAVNKMSVNWWKDRNKELANLKNEYPQYLNYWEQIQQEIDDILQQQQQTLEEKYISEDLEWIVIDSIMYRNYESTEWNALDWAYHSNWGGGSNGFLAQLNKKITREIEKEKAVKITLIQNNFLLSAERQQKEIEKITEDFDKKLERTLVTPVTYFNNPLIQEVLKFYHANFYLYRKDHFGNCYMHSLLPVDDKGEVSIGYVDSNGKFQERDLNGNREKGFIYKNKRYRNKTVLKGLGKIAKDIRAHDINSDNLSNVMEGFTLLTAIYADNTTRIKPANLKQMKEQFGGFFSILEKMGISTLVVGHNPISKLGSKFELEKLKFFNKNLDRQKLTILNSDGEMSSGYQKPYGAGVGIEISLLGVRYRGFLTGDSETFSSDYTPDVSREDTKFTILLNLFPSLKKILLFTEKIYDNFIKTIISLKVLNWGAITKTNSTFVTLTTEDKIKTHIENAHLNGLSAIAIVSNRLNIFSQEEELQKTSISLIGDKKISFTIYSNTILAGNGKEMKVLSYVIDQKDDEISDEEAKTEVVKYIFEQIKNKAYKKIGINVAKNIFTDINIDDGFEQNLKIISNSFEKAMVKSFGILPLLYDLNLPKITELDTLRIQENFDRIKDMLSAA